MRSSDEAFVDDRGATPTIVPAATGGKRGRPLQRLTRGASALLALLTGAIALGGCEGDNIWSASSDSLQPKLLSVSAPSPVSPGDTIQVQVSAYAPRELAAISLQLAGAVSRDTTVTLATPGASQVTSIRVPLPEVFADTVLIVRAIAYDKLGAASRMASDTSSAVAPPAVVGFTGPDSVRAGQVLSLAVHATGVRPVTKIRVWLRSALSMQDSILVQAPSTDVQERILFSVPTAPFVDTTLTVDMQAVDNSGLAGLVYHGMLPVAIPAPVVDSVVVSGPVQAGGILDARVFAHGARPLSQITVSLRGAYTQDVTANPIPLRTGVTQDFAIPLGTSPASSLLTLRVKASDIGGGLSAIYELAVALQ